VAFYDDERAAIEAHFATQWGSTTKIRYDNINWIEPKTESAWVSITIVNQEAEIIELRNPAIYRFPGVVIVQVFVKEGLGSGLANIHADAAVEAFRHRVLEQGSSGKINFRTPYKRRIGTENGWYQVNVVAPFFRNVLLTKPAI